MMRWLWDADMLGALVVDKTGLGKTFNLVAAEMICKLLTEKVVMGLPLAFVWGNTLSEWVNMVQNDFLGTISEERNWYLLQRHCSVPRHLIEIQISPPQGYPALTSTLEPILLVIMPRVTETLPSIIDKMTHETDFKLINLLQAENVNLHKDLNTSCDQPENR
jgi:hypothetical protein